jgi:hypothetical protein
VLEEPPAVPPAAPPPVLDDPPAVPPPVPEAPPPVPVEPSLSVTGANSTHALRDDTTTNARNVTAPAPAPGAVHVKPCWFFETLLVCVSVAIEHPAIDVKPDGIVNDPTKVPDALFAQSRRPLKVVCGFVFDSDSVSGCPGV